MSQPTDPGPGEDPGRAAPEAGAGQIPESVPESAPQVAPESEAATAALPAASLPPPLMAPLQRTAAPAGAAPVLSLTRTQALVGAVVALVLVVLLTFLASIVVANHVVARLGHEGPTVGRMSQHRFLPGRGFGDHFGYPRGGGLGSGHGYGNGYGQRTFPQGSQGPSAPVPSGAPSGSSS